jgi:hypothetical protein
MTRWTTRALGGAAVAASVLGSGMGAAGADPKGGVTHLTCDDGASYEVVVAGNGNWTPAHDSNSNTVFVPTWFGDFHGTVRDADGNVIEDFVEEGDDPKGQSAKKKDDILECTFSFIEVSDGSDPEFPEGFTFTGVGEVRVFATPRS